MGKEIGEGQKPSSSESAPEMMDEEPAGVERLSQDGQSEGTSVCWCR